MKAYQRYIAILILGVATACSEVSIDDAVVNGEVEVVQPSDQSFDDGDAAISLSAVVDGYLSTRSGKEAWSVDDKVDIAFELTSNVTDETIPNIKNYSITNSTSGTLEPCTEDDKIYYRSGNDYSFFAIYPSGGIATESNTYSVDLTDQSDGVASLDMLYATNVVTSQSSSSNENSLSLSFKHQYALVKFNITGASISSSSVIELKGAYSKADFNVMNGTFENQEIANIKLPASSSFELLALPWQNMSEIELIIYNNSSVKLYKPNIVEQDDSMVIWKAGQQYEYNISF